MAAGGAALASVFIRDFKEGKTDGHAVMKALQINDICRA